MGEDRKGKGHKQVLGQATAMLVSFPALLTAKFRAITLPALLDERLAIAGSSDTSALRGVPVIPGHVVELVVNCTVLHVDVDRTIRGHELLRGQARWWRG